MPLVLYPKYAGFIAVYAIIFLTVGVSAARVLDELFPKFNENDNKNENKGKFRYYIEVIIQIALIALVTYLFREIVHFLFARVKSINKHMYGKPDKFAALIIAPTMFAAQPNLINKIKYIWNV
jgi:hypothetical protein